MRIYGRFLIMGNAGCISSTVFLAYIGNRKKKPESYWSLTVPAGLGVEDLGLWASDCAGAISEHFWYGSEAAHVGAKGIRIGFFWALFEYIHTKEPCKE